MSLPEMCLDVLCFPLFWRVIVIVSRFHSLYLFLFCSLLFFFFSLNCLQHCKRPVFVTDYPKAIKPFYMRQNDDGKTVSCFDLLVGPLLPFFFFLDALPFFPSDLFRIAKMPGLFSLYQFAWLYSFSLILCHFSPSDLVLIAKMPGMPSLFIICTFSLSFPFLFFSFLCFFLLLMLGHCPFASVAQMPGLGELAGGSAREERLDRLILPANLEWCEARNHLFSFTI